MYRATQVITLLVALAFPAAASDDGEITVTQSDSGKPIATHQGRRFSLAFEKAMHSFAEKDKADPATGQIVFTGSSSMVGWRTLKQDMAPLPVANRAFGGSNSIQLWYYADRAILPRQPKVIVIYIGDNDMPPKSVTIDSYMKYVKLLVQKVRVSLPHARFAFLASKPSVARWHLWDKYLAANKALKQFCATDPLITYIDITPSLLDEDGVVRQDCYGKDKLHFKKEVYAEWTRIVRPVVERLWAQANAPAPDGETQ